MDLKFRFPTFYRLTTNEFTAKAVHIRHDCVCNVLHIYSNPKIYRPSKIAYQPSTKYKVDILFYEVDLSMDCTEYKGYFCYIIFKLTNLLLM